jgi:hypothetical protein
MSDSSPQTLLRELRRRRVINTTLIYIIGTWLTLLAAGRVLPALAIPEAAIRYVWTGAFLLFPLVLIFAWHYDITRQGIRRNAPRSQPDDTQLFAADHWLIGALLLAAVGVVAVMLMRIGQA